MAVLTYKCPNCEGPLKWNGSKDRFICEYCDSMFTREDIAKLIPDKQDSKTVSREEAEALGLNTDGAEKVQTDTSGQENAVDLATSKATPAGETANEASDQAESEKAKQPASMKAGKVKVYNCPSCGAQIAVDATTAATECFYCGTPVVISDKLEGTFDPDFVIPFEIDKKKAKEIFQAWLSQHKYVPAAFYKNRIDEIKGVYFPYWVYSADIDSQVTARGTIARTFQAAGMQVTEKNIYNLNQSGKVDVNDISCIALKKASKDLCENVMPFDFNDKKDFDSTYLQGYMAEIRDIDQNDIKDKINQEVQEYAKNQVLSNVGASGYSEIQIQNLSLSKNSESYKYAMLPVWTLTYKGGDGKIYYFSINGQTGKTCGVLPVDDGKLKKLFFMVAIPVFVILLLLQYFLL